MAKRMYHRKKKYYRRSEQNNYLKLLNLFLIIALLGVTVSHSTTYISLNSESNSLLDYLYETVSMHIISLVLPGINQTVNSNISDIEKPLTSRTTDHLTPETTVAEKNLNTEQSAGGLQPLSSFSKHNPEHNSEEPRIIIPSQTAFSGMGEIIIYHTHTTESFKPTSGSNFTEDLALTVVRLGEELAKILENEYGIPVVHDKTIHDVPRTPAYEKALPTITKLLDEYSDAKLVIDLHRDGQLRSVTTTDLNGEPVAKMLFMVGTRNNPHWHQNKKSSIFLHNELTKIDAGLSRGVDEKPINYNQHVHPNALLIEIGGNNNSLEEALRSIPYLAQALADLYKSNL